MRDENNKGANETEAAFALDVFLTNLLLAALLGAIVWIIYSALSGNVEIKIYLRSASLLYSS